jgi:hypothetical protein
MNSSFIFSRIGNARENRRSTDRKLSPMNVFLGSIPTLRQSITIAVLFWPTRCHGNRFHLRSRSIWQSARETRCPIHWPALPERYCCPRSSPTVPEPWLQTFRLSNWERKIPASACCDSGSGTACGPCTPRAAGRGSRNPMTQHERDIHDKVVPSQASLAAALMACALTWNDCSNDRSRC